MVEAQVDGPGPVDALIHAGSSRSIRTVKLRPKTALFAAFQKADVVRPFLNASDRKHVPGGVWIISIQVRTLFVYRAVRYEENATYRRSDRRNAICFHLPKCGPW